MGHRLPRDDMKIYVETYGCQMNECDSATIHAILRAAGHTRAATPGEADAVIVNTCAVRERAEIRVLGRLRHLRGLIPASATLGVVGCVAQRMGDALVKEVRGLGFVLGTERYHELPAVLARAAEGLRTIDTALDRPAPETAPPRRTEARLCDFLSVMRGCDNFCSYCVVPFVRGRERSTPAASVVSEVESLVALGTRDVTLIGQNVNSYRDGASDFADLLRRVNEVPGLARLRFATSHPKDMCDDLIEAATQCDKVCEHVHLPVQSGSDETLAAMNRRYTRHDYTDLVERIRERIPGVAVTTDVIVGFPGETEDRFNATLSLMREVRFDSAFMFRYSVRPGTAAAELVDDVPEALKIERLETVIRLQKGVSEERNAALVGTSQEVLVEGPSERDPAVLYGKTRTGKAVIAGGPPETRGTLQVVRVTGSTAWTLRGELEPARG
jgi:tRNA-2-methylthio-N6-dimethylallyladenosine synthase